MASVHGAPQKPSSVVPADADLRLLAEAAAARQTDAAAAERLLQTYPDLRQVAPDQRGQVLYQKVRADLIVGIPLGIWLGLLWATALGVALSLGATVAACRLLRRHGRLPADERAALAAQCMHSVILPCARALLGDDADAVLTAARA